MATKHDKRQDFLWMVQTFMLIDEKDVGWRGSVGDAIAASYRIPDELDAREAALQFWGFISPEARGGEKRQCPPWLTMLSDPNYS